MSKNKSLWWYWQLILRWILAHCEIQADHINVFVVFIRDNWALEAFSVWVWIITDHIWILMFWGLHKFEVFLGNSATEFKRSFQVGCFLFISGNYFCWLLFFFNCIINFDLCIIRWLIWLNIICFVVVVVFYWGIVGLFVFTLGVTWNCTLSFT